MLETGVNLVYIRNILGHKSITTTEIYAKTNPEIKRKATENNSQSIKVSDRYSSKNKNDLLNCLKPSRQKLGFKQKIISYEICFEFKHYSDINASLFVIF